MRTSEEGSIAPQLMAALLILAAMLSGLALLLRSSFTYEKRSRVASERRAVLEKALAETVAILEEDDTPDSDGPDDAVFGKTMSDDGLVEISVREVSSSINANFIKAELLADTPLKSMMASGMNADAFRQFRAEKGISTDKLRYKDVFTEEALPAVSVFGWANVNEADPSSLEALYASITGDEGGAAGFRGQAEALWTGKKIVKPDELDDFLGSESAALKTVITAVPSYNLHFMDDAVIKAIVEYPPFKIEKAAEKANALITQKASGGATPLTIMSALGVAKDHRVLQYFGATSWFWEIRATSEFNGLTAVAARDPRSSSETGKGSSRILVVDKAFDR